jgi:hypothetical protein
MATRLEREFARKRNSDPTGDRTTAAACSIARGGAGSDEHPHDRRLSSDGSIDLSNIAGEIVVTGWDRREAQIKATSERGRLMLDLASSRLTLKRSVADPRRGSGRRERPGTKSWPAVSVVARSTSGSITVRGTVAGRGQFDERRRGGHRRDPARRGEFDLR